MCHAPHKENTKFTYLFHEHIKLCMDCYKSWNTFYHHHLNYYVSFVNDKIRGKIWVEWITLREAELRKEKVQFT